LLALPALTVAVLVCFVTKGFTVDDPLFVWLGQQIHADPIDFFGFDVLWTGKWEPMHEVTKNPPLTGYYIAAVAALFGWSEVALHLAFLVPAAAAAAGIHALARRLTSDPFAAGLLAVFSPVFLVSSTNVMSDTMMLAFFCWALVLWLRGVDEGRRRDLLLASVLAGIALLTKYFAVALLPLFAAYALAKRRSLAGWPVCLLPALAIATGYELVAHALYGHGLLLYAADYATSFRGEEEVGVLQQAFVGLVFAGGCFIAPLFFAPGLWSWKTLVPVAAALLVGAATADAWFPTVGVPLETSIPMTFGAALQVVVFAASGIFLLALAAAELKRARGPDEWLLFLWVFGTFAFAALVNWVNNGRSNLPLAPVGAILVVRRLSLQGGQGGRSRLAFALAFVPTAFVAWAATYADYSWANRVREDARELAEAYVPRAPAVRFLGTWGFQYYMEEGGAHSVDGAGEIFQPGELLIVPNNNNKIDLQGVGEPYAEFLARRVDTNPFWMWTMSWENRAGFYASNYGPLPYAIGSVRSDVYEIWRVKQGFQVHALDDG